VKHSLALLRRPAATLGASALALIVFGAGCHGSDSTQPPALDLASITIDNASFQIERGYHQALTATVKTKAGETVTVPVVWRSSNERVATVDANGKLAALDTGTTTVTASTLGLTSQPIGVLVAWVGPAKVTAYQYTAPVAATPAVTVPDSIRVQVTNRNGGLVGGARVVFSTTAGGGTVTPVATVLTNSAGVAAAQWKLGPALGANTVTASVVGDDDKSLTFVDSNPDTFSITTYNALRANGGDGQTGQIMSTLPIPPSVKLVDAAGNPRAGVPVSFTPVGGGRVATTTVSTGADGVASPGSWTLGDVTGAQSLLARVEAAQLSLGATATGTAIHYQPSLIAAGDSATCAIVSSAAATADCWGQQPKVGDGTTTNRSTPTATSGGVSFSSLVGSATHFCGVATNGSLYCWGPNAFADVTGAALSSSTPSKVSSALTWTMAAPGYQHNCALASDHTVYCWGDNSFYQLGDGTPVVPGTTPSPRYAPAPVAGGFQFKSVASGNLHACALGLDGSAFCWGRNGNGQLGEGTTSDRSSPTAVGGSLTFQSIGAGDFWTCGLTAAGRLYCWGAISSTNVTQSTPKSYPNAPVFASLSVGKRHACALTADGTAYCWGSNTTGQIGDSTTTERPDPTPVAGGLKFSSISAGSSHTCGRTMDSSVACWGLNRAGELGDNTATIRLTPRYIVLGVTP
jgi:alpha-tubulin suppressor-like RCC1 family protein